ncbi:MAG: SOS response-associated peptidase [Minwuia sp.]|uniref:SOS response-associated peptidase n=1 Tax=Minwuia sp. TaxID=2493630 RepID=UPI003A88E7A8
MCGRYSLTTPLEALRRVFAFEGSPNLQPRYNIAPTQEAPVFRRHPDGRLLCHPLRWGLIPSWSKDMSGAARMINARAETVAEKPAFRAAFARRRCLVPADGFYEWEKLEGGEKQPWRIVIGDSEPFAFAGLWERWEHPDEGRIDSYTIITTEAAPSIANIHHRMPVILAEADHASWLDAEAGADDLLPLLKPNARATGYRVSKRVGNVKNDDVELLADIDA